MRDRRRLELLERTTRRYDVCVYVIDNVVVVDTLGISNTARGFRHDVSVALSYIERDKAPPYIRDPLMRKVNKSRRSLPAANRDVMVSRAPALSLQTAARSDITLCTPEQGYRKNFSLFEEN
ncbi:hypothetical protein EVAR_7797_1 [Eumeta japonica]|uniref:Uncharacterized protein n=1 Tax=Eumeta variegata TaxID=151549 RepID=A0A4C1TMB7_EUMVA|nr:hypothetical protein EVAR_7797_1 [Eumeta japonica]